MLSGRLENVLGGAALSLLLCGLFFLIALIVKVALKKKIDSPRYYSIASPSGFPLYLILTSALSVNASHADEDASPSHIQLQTGLDAPFIAPSEEYLEKLSRQLPRLC